MTNNNYVPERKDIVWLDFEPTKGKEIGKYRPALVLSSQSYNKQTGLLICSPISTSIRGSSAEVEIDNLDKPSVVAASIVQTLSWQQRKVKFINKISDVNFEAVLSKLLPLLGAEILLNKHLS